MYNKPRFSQKLHYPIISHRYLLNLLLVLFYKSKASTALPKMEGILVLSVSCRTVPLMGLLDDILLMTIHQSYIKDKWKHPENILTKTTF